MSKSLRTKLAVVLAAICAVLIALSCSFAAANAEERTESVGENVIYSEDFADGIPEGFDNLEPVADYGALLKSGSFILPVAEEKLPASNNYEICFDLHLNASATVYMYLKGLAVDKTTGVAGDIQLRVEADGTYWILDSGNNFQIYNNSGNEHGALDYSPVALLDGVARVKVVHFEGYVELWINGTRRIVTHLEGFGNNNYNKRCAYDEGRITGIEFASSAQNAVCLGNITVSEAQGKATEYYEANSSADTGAYVKQFDLSAQNLYNENYLIETTFNVYDSSKSGYYPTLRLFGINNSLTEQYGGENAYFINIQSYVDGSNFNPGIYYHTPEKLNGDWEGRSGTAVTADADGNMTYRVEVYGDNFVLYLNGEAAIRTTFGEMGIPKGHLQYMAVRDTNSDTGARWTSFRYAGFAEQTAATVTADKQRLMAGETLNLTADVFGVKEGHDFFWYVDGVKREEQGLTLALDGLSEGSHVIAYKSASVSSNEVEVSVSDRMITISSDAEGRTVYPTDEVTFSAVLDGDFTGETGKWYVNGEEQTEAGTVLTLNGLAAGEYVIEYRTESVTGNQVRLTVSEGFVTVVTVKGSYFDSESAVFTAELTGISESAAIKWYVDGVEAGGETGNTFTLSLEGAEIGSQIAVKCSADGVESNEVSVSVVYDVSAKIKADEFYKELPQVEITAGGSYGDYAVGSDGDGTYLYCDKAGGPYWQYSGQMPTGTAFIFSYKLYIPEDINGKYYIYPCLQGMNSKYPDLSMETSVEVNPTGLRPYIKDQGTNVSYDVSEYGFGKDLSYGGGIADKGGWTDISVAVDGMYISMYINGEIVLFFRLSTATVASAVYFNMWPDAGDTIPVRMKDIKFACIAEPAPDLKAVTVTVSETEIAAGGSVTFTARPDPFNAETNSVSWYVNGEAAEGAGLTFVFTTEQAGEYKVWCVIDGIKSNERAVTVTAAPQEGNSALLWTLVGTGIGLIVIGGGLAAFFIVRKKKKSR